jgi:hypothetical protein
MAYNQIVTVYPDTVVMFREVPVRKNFIDFGTPDRIGIFRPHPANLPRRAAHITVGKTDIIDTRLPLLRKQVVVSSENRGVDDNIISQRFILSRRPAKI